MNQVFAFAFTLCCISVKCLGTRNTEAVNKDILLTLVTMQTQIKQLNDHLNEETRKSNILTKKLESEINKLTDEHNFSNTKTRDLETRLEQEIEKTKKLELKMDVLLRAHIYTTGETCLTKRVTGDVTTKIAFSAYMDHFVQNLGPGQILLFGRVVLNEGNAYNPYTGIFTVPISGVYMITTALESMFSHSQWFNIIADGEIISTVVFWPLSERHHAMGTNVVLVRLNKGQNVWVAVSTYDSGESLQGQPDVRATTFSGLYLF